MPTQQGFEADREARRAAQYKARQDARVHIGDNLEMIASTHRANAFQWMRNNRQPRVTHAKAIVYFDNQFAFDTQPWENRSALNPWSERYSKLYNRRGLEGLAKKPGTAFFDRTSLDAEVHALGDLASRLSGIARNPQAGPQRSVKIDIVSDLGTCNECKCRVQQFADDLAQMFPGRKVEVKTLYTQASGKASTGMNNQDVYGYADANTRYSAADPSHYLYWEHKFTPRQNPQDFNEFMRSVSAANPKQLNPTPYSSPEGDYRSPMTAPSGSPVGHRRTGSDGSDNSRGSDQSVQRLTADMASLKVSGSNTAQSSRMPAASSSTTRPAATYPATQTYPRPSGRR
jgi:hypothetical protein